MQDNGPQPLYVRSKQKVTHEIIIGFITRTDLDLCDLQYLQFLVMGHAAK